MKNNMKYLLLLVLLYQFNAQGEVFGTLDDVPFSQTIIYEDLQKFQMGEEYWYINDNGVFYADNDLQAISIYDSQK